MYNELTKWRLKHSLSKTEKKRLVELWYRIHSFNSGDYGNHANIIYSSSCEAIELLVSKAILDCHEPDIAISCYSLTEKGIDVLSDLESFIEPSVYNLRFLRFNIIGD